MCSTCTQCMCTCKNAKFNPLEIKKIRAFHKYTKLYTLKILYLYGIMYVCTCTYNNTLPF